MRLIWVSLFLFSLTACQTASDPQSLGGYERVSTWSEKTFSAPDFALKYWFRFPSTSSSKASTLWVIIEGDGASWSRAGNPPLNPTPRKAQGRVIARATPQDRAVLYIARPCQFLTTVQLHTCDMKYWTSQRFSQSVLNALDQVIETVKTQRGETSIALVGYSGGGVLAAELALMRSDVTSLTTVASPLDLELWAQVHNISPVHSPTNPVQLLDRLAARDIQKRFLFGERDKIVPANSLTRVYNKLSPQDVEILPRHTHSAEWSPAVIK